MIFIKKQGNGWIFLLISGKMIDSAAIPLV